MKIRKSIIALTVTTVLSGGVHAAGVWTGDFNTSNGSLVNDGLLLNINGMDVYSQGSSGIFRADDTQLDPSGSTSIAVGDTVRVRYQGVVSGYNPALASPFLNTFTNPTGTYQLTVAVIFDELVLDVQGGGALAILQPIPGTGRASLFYDQAGLTGGGTFINDAADILAGVGYTDGLMIADGGLGSTLSNTFTTDGTNASGSAALNGPLSFGQLGIDDPANLADVVGFIPVPEGYTATTTLQFGPGEGTDFQTQNFFDTNAYGYTSLASTPALTIRADANINFAVPEPASLALFSLGLLGFGLNRRRRLD